MASKAAIPRKPRRFTLTPRLRRQLWPHIFTREVPYALPLCRWAARNGALVHPSIYLRRSNKQGNYIAARRALRRGTVLMSLPLELAVATSVLDRSPGIATPMEQLLHHVARGLHDQTCPWYDYYQFLHDSYNDDDLRVLNDDALEAEVDALLDGNALNAVGVGNAPFLNSRSLSVPASRVAVDRAVQSVRAARQSVPYFAASSVAWALSMAMSRSVADTEGELTLFPLIDLCNHSFSPSAHYYISTPRGESRTSGGGRNVRGLGDSRVTFRGVRGWDEARAHVHLLAVRDIEPGGSVTLLYSDETPYVEELSVEARQAIAERWLVQWGFVPRAPAGRWPTMTRAEALAAVDDILKGATCA